MTLEELQQSVDKDFKLDDTELDTESTKIPLLHNKYLQHYNKFSLLLKKAEQDHKGLVREKWEYDICHLDKSTHIPMGQLLERIEELDKTLKHVVVCHHGIRSRMVAKHLISIGFEKVINLSTGVEGWANDVDSTMSKYA